MTDSASTGAALARRYEDVLVVTIDHPPVNALSAAVRADAIDTVRRDDAGRLHLTLRGTPETLAVSRLYAGRFKGL